jgi:hypothetical protein
MIKSIWPDEGAGFYILKVLPRTIPEPLAVDWEWLPSDDPDVQRAKIGTAVLRRQRDGEAWSEWVREGEHDVGA